MSRAEQYATDSDQYLSFKSAGCIRKAHCSRLLFAISKLHAVIKVYDNRKMEIINLLPIQAERILINEREIERERERERERRERERERFRFI